MSKGHRGRGRPRNIWKKTQGGYMDSELQVQLEEDGGSCAGQLDEDKWSVVQSIMSGVIQKYARDANDVNDVDKQNVHQNCINVWFQKLTCALMISKR